MGGDFAKFCGLLRIYELYFSGQREPILPSTFIMSFLFGILKFQFFFLHYVVIMQISLVVRVILKYVFANAIFSYIILVGLQNRLLCKTQNEVIKKGKIHFTQFAPTEQFRKCLGYKKRGVENQMLFIVQRFFFQTVESFLDCPIQNPQRDRP